MDKVVVWLELSEGVYRLVVVREFDVGNYGEFEYVGWIFGFNYELLGG